MRIKIQKELNAAKGTMLLNIDIELRKGEFVTLYGESGAGKTSVLRMIAGLMKAESGFISIENDIWFDTNNGIDVSPQKRKTGYVFQEFTLFPNMTVRNNLKYALEKKQDAAIVDDLIELIELGDLKDRKPENLSGGQKQRVALARALVRKPQILMLDEPLSALDRSMRSKLQDYILKVHKEYQLTTLMISHEISEVIKMSDRIFMLENGRISRSGNPVELFSNKKVSGKFQFTGEIISIVKEDVIYIINILIGSNFVKVVADESEAKEDQAGDKVLVASKAFNPMIQKLG